MKIDAHQHVWQLSRGDYGWITAELPALFRDFTLADLLPHLNACGIDRSVLVQAAASLDETRFLLELADREPRIAGVVGWVDLSSPQACAHIDELAVHPRLVGIRPMLQDIDDTDWVLQQPVVNALQYVAASGLTFDALVQPRHLDAIALLAQRVPKLPIVIDHAAKPVMARGRSPDAAWLRGLARLAAMPQIHCKLSGLATEFGEGWTVRELRPFACAVLERFGAGRVMWGSDWPVLELVGTYEGWHAASVELTSTLGTEERAFVFGGTAMRFYRLPPARAPA